MKRIFPALCLTLSLCACAGPDHDETGQWVDLLDKELSHWDVYLSYPGNVIMSVIEGTARKNLEPIGLNKDEKGVFSIITEDGQPILRITGEIYGAAATKQEFSKFHFKAKFKWGEKKWEPRLTELKDSGILYYSVGDFGVDYWHSWMEAQEMQIIEGGIGDYWTIAGAQIDIPAIKPPGEELYVYSPGAPALHFSAGDSETAVANHCRRGEDRELSKQWNEVELICYEGDCVHIANGSVVMTLENSRRARDGKVVPLTRGKIQIQSEAAKVFYKDIKIKPIDAMPVEYGKYFGRSG